MKFEVTFKDPDAVYYDDAGNELEAEKREKAEEFARTWLEYGEYVTIEFDTKAKEPSTRGCATVKKVK